MKPKQIVVCEDDIKALRDLRIVFNTNQSKILKEFSEGIEFLEWFKKNSQQVDLIILDILLKKMDGFALFHEIKKIKSQIPIIIFSIENSISVVKYLVSEGARDYITKPYQLEQLKQRLSKYI
ncbi:MAG: response regulator [Leptonema sp. (in: bacteria)]